ncbi:MAG TPA: hypothetical protein PKZ02_01960 [Candidatus Paceibacterota bacterium]|nr:hypothetical protein [Candidatus Paceibacterota bacterium]
MHMQTADPKIFKAYDIRGKYPKEINRKLAFQFGYFLPKIIKFGKKPRKILVAADTRPSSLILKSQLIKGLLRNKISVIDADRVSTPMLYLGVKQTKSDLGIMITASHLGKEYNGLKVCRSNLQIISGIELRKYAKLFNQPIVNAPILGKCRKKDLLNDYIDFLLKKANFSLKEKIYCKKIKIGIIPPTTTVKLALEKIARKIPLKINSASAQKNKNDFAIGFDSDADRIFFFNNLGQPILGDTIAALIADWLLKKHKGKKTIITDKRSSYLITEIVQKNKGKIFYSRVGHSFFKKEMTKRQAIFGNEKIGHYYWQVLFYVDDGIFTLLQLLKCLAFNQMPLTDLTKRYQKYATLPEQNFQVKNPKEKIKAVRKHFQKQSQRTSLSDGLTMQFKEWRFNLRLSETEPLLRLNIEAISKTILKKKFEEVKKIIKQ